MEGGQGERRLLYRALLVTLKEQKENPMYNF